MLARVNSSAVVGLDAVGVEVEIDIASQGLPSFTIVGLPDKAVEEAKERVRSAIKNIGADMPAKRITVNLAPADLPKEGASYDLPIAIGILLASGQISVDLSDSLLIGELSLDGRLRHVSGTLSHSLFAKSKHFTNIFLPHINAQEASLVSGITIYPIETLRDLTLHLLKTTPISPQPPLPTSTDNPLYDFDMQDIQGQEQAKRALEIAAAGHHNLLLKGPPGAGKTLLAKTFPSILPPLTFDEAIEVTKIYSISGLLQKPIMTKRPFRSPHHTTSHIGLIGGGAHPHPGEISLAHRGVLFCDEFPEFPRHVLEAMRQPLEDGTITISRAHSRITYPAQFMLFAAQNPCPCGFFGDKTHTCTCSPMTINRYQKKLSGPLLDRIDIHLDVPAVTITKLQEKSQAEPSCAIRKRVIHARDTQKNRFTGKKLITNSEMSSKDIKELCLISDTSKKLLVHATEKLSLSARSYYRTIKLAQTIADLSDSKTIEPIHISEALQYRPTQNSY